jgi:hypothetical protein
MYTESQVREKLDKDGYNQAEIEVILNHFPWDYSMDFNGQNCDDLGDDWNNGVPCTGWDGLSRRCNCGNRRVSWIVEGEFAYGEAH